MNPTPCILHTRFCFASTYPIKQAEFIYSLTHYAKGTPHKFFDLVDCLNVLNFRIFFTPFSRVLFTFPSRYLFTIGLNSIFRQRRWASFYSNNLICFTSKNQMLKKDYWTVTIFGQGSHLVLFLSGFGLSFPLSFANTYGISVDFFS